MIIKTIIMVIMMKIMMMVIMVNMMVIVKLLLAILVFGCMIRDEVSQTTSNDSPLFHSSQNPTRKLAARTFIQSQYLKAFESTRCELASWLLQ